MDELRTPFFVIACVLLLLAWLAELGSSILPNGVAVTTGQLVESAKAELVKDPDIDDPDEVIADMRDQLQNSAEAPKPPGIGIPYTALLDGLLVFSVAMTALALIVPERVQGKVQGIAALIVSIVALLLGIVMIFAGIGLVLLMIGLLFAVPFGTIAYMVKFAFFDRSTAEIILSWVMLLKLGFVLFLVLAHQRFLQNKSLVLLIVTSLVASFVVGFLQAFPPLPLVSITDAIGGIIAAVLAVIWAIFFLIFAVVSVFRAVT